MMTRARALSGISHGPITHLSVGNPGAYVGRLDWENAAGHRPVTHDRRTSTHLGRSGFLKADAQDPLD